MRSGLSSYASLAILVALSTPAVSVAVWGQCGGIGYTGSTVCDAGSHCAYVNDYYSQCQPGDATTTVPTSTSTAPTGTNSICPGTLTKFKYFGVNEAGAEFGNQNIPGALGTDYIWPAPSSIDYFVSQGFNFFRVPFQQERLNPPSTGLLGPFNSTYLDGLKSTVSYITGKGAFVAIDPHNFMRYNGNIITSTSDFQTWWKNLANEFKSNSRVIFDVMNEPNGIDASVVFNLNQAAINGIRSSGATSQLILVEGTSWTGAWTWTSSGNSNVFGAIKDPNNNVAIQMHQYLDSDGSGTSATCVSSTIGAERLQAATQWLKQNNLKGFLGEMGTGSNSACISAVQGALCAMQQSGVWIGMSWWAAGPWWGTYFQSIEPPDGASISQILPQALKPFLAARRVNALLFSSVSLKDHAALMMAGCVGADGPWVWMTGGGLLWRLTSSELCAHYLQKHAFTSRFTTCRVCLHRVLRLEPHTPTLSDGYLYALLRLAVAVLQSSI